MKRDFFGYGRDKALAGLLLAVVPGTIALAAAFAMRRRRHPAATGAEPTELDYEPAENIFPYEPLQRRWA